jgi:hypothetical protein
VGGALSEIEDQVSVFGAADEALLRYADEPTVLESVAALLGPYRDGALGWFRQFEALVEESGADPIPPVERALTRMAEEEPEGLLRSRRVLAIAALARADPRYRDYEDRRPLLVRALQPLSREEDFNQADRLLEVLSDPGWGLDQWGEVVTEVGLFDDETALQTVPPCSGDLVWWGRPGDRDPVPVLQTHFCLPDLRIEDLKRYLDPANWPTCNPLWKRMDRRNPGEYPPRYLEVISLARERGSAWELRTCLTFTTRNLTPDGSVVAVEYRLCDERPPEDNRRVSVDEGTIVARQRGNDVCIDTSKKVQFATPIDGPALAMVVCALGWNAHAQAMVYTCMRRGKVPKAPWAPDSGVPECGGGLDPAGVLDQLVDVTTSCLKECAGAYRDWYEKAMSGTYGADDYVRSMADMWARATRDMSQIAALGGRLGRSNPVGTRPVPPSPHRSSPRHAGNTSSVTIRPGEA